MKIWHKNDKNREIKKLKIFVSSNFHVLSYRYNGQQEMIKSELVCNQ